LYLQNCQDENNPKRLEATASWVTVLLGRLEQCLQGIQQLTNEATNMNVVNSKHYKSWWAVVAPCIHALCLLIETNNDALEQVLMQRQKFCATVFQLLQASLPGQEHLAPALAALLYHSALYAARSLHSALDDNYELAKTVMQYLQINVGSMERCLQYQENPRATDDDSTTKQPYLMVQLHLIGGLVNLYPFLQHQNGSNMVVENLLLNYAVSPTTATMAAAVSPMRSDDAVISRRLLFHPVRTVESEISSRWESLRQMHQDARALAKKQAQDEQIENEVVKLVQDRKEPARDIARRQKKQQEQEEAERRQRLEAMDVDMEDVDDPSSTRGKFDKHEQNGEEATEEALQAWNAAMGPLQLSLEILANLLTTFIMEDQDDVNMAIDGDGTPLQTSPEIANSGIFQALQSSDVSASLCRTIGHLSTFQMETHCDHDELMGTQITTDMEEAIIKACACMSNCILSKIMPTSEYQSTWKSLVQYVSDATKQRMTGKVPSMEGLTSTLAVLLQRQPLLLVENQGHFDLMQELLAADACCLAAQRNIVSLLSAVIAADTDANKDSSVVRHLSRKFGLLLEQKDEHLHDDHKAKLAALQCEVLNGLMDWYGQDDFYPDIYQELKLSGMVQECLQRISMSKLPLSQEEVEILENAERFVEYKQSL
jgi:hypothetical protein